MSETPKKIVIIDDDKKTTVLEALGDPPNEDESVKKMVQLIVSMPEYQFC